ncbi:MAG: UPF0176 protein [Pseudomonadales bacterium]
MLWIYVPARSKGNTMSPVVVSTMYKFVNLDNFEQLRQPLLQSMLDNDVKGTLLLAQEGINGTVAGSRTGIDAVLDWLRQDPRLADIDNKESFDDEMPFYRSKVKLKKEIVTMGVEGIDPKQVVGTYVKPEDWNALISDPEVVLVDTRNQYEVNIGTFKGAIDPHTDSFRQFPDYVKQNLDPARHKKIAMFCTGGIRCEKSTAYMKEQGFEEVYHLEGGILKYLEKVPPKVTMWQGECFVFDNRVTVDHSLEKGKYDQCNACRMPITKEEQTSEHFVVGISCPYCYDKTSIEQRQRFEQRQKQMELANVRGEAHIGSDVKETRVIRRNKKLSAKNEQKEVGKTQTE